MLPATSLVSRGLAVILTSLLASCATTYKPVNQAITEVDESAGYRRVTKDRGEQMGDTAILLAFSGGGTRAAALSYGVMQELRDTYIDSRGTQVRMLDEVDTISSVSGGSFTAAYYGVFREGLFEDYEKAFIPESMRAWLRADRPVASSQPINAASWSALTSSGMVGTISRSR